MMQANKSSRRFGSSFATLATRWSCVERRNYWKLTILLCTVFVSKSTAEPAPGPEPGPAPGPERPLAFRATESDVTCSEVRLILSEKVKNIGETTGATSSSSQHQQHDVCSQDSICCTDQMESWLMLQSGTEMKKMLVEKMKSIKQTFVTWTAKFDSFFQGLLERSKRSLYDLFNRSYAPFFEHNSQIFIQLYIDLRSHYKSDELNLEDVLDRFFTALLQRMFSLLNEDLELTEEYLQCVAEHMDLLRPFNDVPKKLYSEIKRTFLAARAFVQGLSQGKEIILTMIKQSPDDECSKTMARMLFCQFCEGHTSARPCFDHCVSTVGRCLSQQIELQDDWTNYLRDLLRVADRLAEPFNFEGVVRLLDVKISDAVMNYQENSINVTTLVIQNCGNPPPKSRQRRELKSDDEISTSPEFIPSSASSQSSSSSSQSPSSFSPSSSSSSPSPSFSSSSLSSNSSSASSLLSSSSSSLSVSSSSSPSSSDSSDSSPSPTTRPKSGQRQQQRKQQRQRQQQEEQQREGQPEQREEQQRLLQTRQPEQREEQDEEQTQRQPVQQEQGQPEQQEEQHREEQHEDSPRRQQQQQREEQPRLSKQQKEQRRKQRQRQRLQEEQRRQQQEELARQQQLYDEQQRQPLLRQPQESDQYIEQPPVEQQRQRVQQNKTTSSQQNRKQREPGQPRQHQQQTKQQRRPDTSPAAMTELEVLLRDVRRKLEALRTFWAGLPLSICGDVTADSNNETTCWNGIDLSRREGVAVDSGYIREPVTLSSTIRQQILKLKVASDKLRQAYNGWSENDLDGSGNGLDFGSGMELETQAPSFDEIRTNPPEVATSTTGGAIKTHRRLTSGSRRTESVAVLVPVLLSLFIFVSH